MNFFLVLITAVVLIALAMLSFGLTSFFSRQKKRKITACSIAKEEEINCGCDNVENCYNKQV